MWSENLRNKLPIIFSFLFLGLAIWFLNFLTPEYNDDIAYKFMFTQGDVNGPDINRPIHNFSDVVISQFNHYFLWNGRIIPHLIVQSFTGFIGKTYFNVINSCFFCFFIFFLCKLVNLKIVPSNLFFTAAVVLFLMPSFSETVLWMSGSVNYLWTSTGACLFLWLLTRFKNTPISPLTIIFAILSILLGCTHEGLTMPMAVSLIVYFLIYRKNISPSGPLLILGYVIGALICSFAPATVNRAGIDSTGIRELVISRIQALFVVSFKLRAFWVLLLCVIITLFRRKDKKDFIRSFYLNNMIEWNTLFLSFGIVLVSGFYALRGAIGVELFSIILILQILRINSYKNSVYFKYMISGMGLALYVVICVYSIPNYVYYKDMLRQIKSSATNIIVNRTPAIPSYIAKYIVPHVMVDQYNPNNPYNIFEAASLNKPTLSFIPEDVIEAIIANDTILKDISLQKSLPFYIVPLDPDQSSRKKIIYKLRKPYPSEIPFYLRKFASGMDRFSLEELEIDPENTYVFKFNDKRFRFISRNPVIDYRVVGLKFE